MHADVRNACTIFPEEPEYKKPLGIPRLIWQDSTKVGIKLFTFSLFNDPFN
jgi:hypothetical protein